MAKPVMKVVFKDKDGQFADAAVVWPATMKDGTVLEGRYNFSPSLETTDGKYPTISLADALERVANKEGYLNVQLGFDEEGNKLTIQPENGF